MKDAYVTLIRSFLDEKLPAADFERQFLERFKGDGSLDERTYEILNALFYVVESFVADPALRDQEDADEAQMREAAKVALAALKP